MAPLIFILCLVCWKSSYNSKTAKDNFISHGVEMHKIFWTADKECWAIDLAKSASVPSKTLAKGIVVLVYFRNFLCFLFLQVGIGKTSGSAQQLPRPTGSTAKGDGIDPYVTVQIFGIPADCFESRTKTVSNQESFEFNINLPEVALVRFVVLDDDFIGDEFIGQYTIPLECIRPGKLTAKKSTRGKRIQSEMRPIGIKSIDESFKDVEPVLAESARLRLEVDQAMANLRVECGLPETDNIQQCLRAIIKRFRNSTDVTMVKLVAEHGLIEQTVSARMGFKLFRCLEIDHSRVKFVCLFCPSYGHREGILLNRVIFVFISCNQRCHREFFASQRQYEGNKKLTDCLRKALPEALAMPSVHAFPLYGLQALLLQFPTLKAEGTLNPHLFSQTTHTRGGSALYIDLTLNLEYEGGTTVVECYTAKARKYKSLGEKKKISQAITPEAYNLKALCPPASFMRALSEAYERILNFYENINYLCLESGLKGKKYNKALENFAWNVTVLRGQLDLMQAYNKDCQQSLTQCCVDRIFPPENQLRMPSMTKKYIFMTPIRCIMDKRSKKPQRYDPI
ncbi:Inactive phospholipase C-like protein 2 [Nymphon striatum]|nr:Inactive phospholipase C-like protein 2 [Nymphon striatum]